MTAPKVRRATTAVPATVAPLGIEVGDPPVQAVANKLDELIGAPSRAPEQAGR